MLEDIFPDWDEEGTKKELQETIGDEFVWNGPGIYLTDTDTLLIVTKERADGNKVTVNNIWQGYQPPETVYVAYCYNRPYHETLFSAIASTPIREDSRSK